MERAVKATVGNRKSMNSAAMATVAMTTDTSVYSLLCYR